MSKTVYTTCRYCESNCALAVEVENNRVKKITADKKNPSTWQDTCSKGLTAKEIVEHPKRITAPMKKVGDKYVEVSYEQAIEEISESLTAIKNEHGADAIAYYFGNPLGFNASLTFSLGLFTGLGTQNRYNASSIDQNNNHVVSTALFGLTYVPLNPDIENADYMLLIGMNPAESKFAWMGCTSNGWEKARKAMQERNAKVVIVDPRKTKSAAQASEHITIKPGNDWALLLGIIKTILEQGLEDKQACAALPQEQLHAISTVCDTANLQHLVRLSGVTEDNIIAIATEFSQAKHAMCLTQTGVSLSGNGTIGHWLGLVLDIITGNFDQKGSRHWEPGFVNMTNFSKQDAQAETLSRVRQLQTVLGYRSLAELPDEINTPGQGQAKALLIHCGNPVVSGPNGRELDKAIKKLDLVIAVDLMQRESHRHADWLIPGEHWLERGELNTTLANGSDLPVVQYAEQAIKSPATIKPEWEFFIDLALAMKVPMLGKPGFNSMIRFSRWLAKVAKKPHWAMSPDLLAKLMLMADKKVTWKQLQKNRHGFKYAEKSYGQLKTMMDNAIQIAPKQFINELEQLITTQAETCEAYPFTMIGKRDLNMMNSWLMELPNKQKRETENHCEIHPEDAKRLTISDGDNIKVSSTVGEIILTASLCEKLSPGIVCVQHGWGSRIFNPYDSGEKPEVYGSNKNLLVDHKTVDKFSSTPKLGATAVSIQAV